MSADRPAGDPRPGGRPRDARPVSPADLAAAGHRLIPCLCGPSDGNAIAVPPGHPVRPALRYAVFDGTHYRADVEHVYELRVPPATGRAPAGARGGMAYVYAGYRPVGG